MFLIKTRSPSPGCTGNSIRVIGERVRQCTAEYLPPPDILSPMFKRDNTDFL